VSLEYVPKYEDAVMLVFRMLRKFGKKVDRKKLEQIGVIA